MDTQLHIAASPEKVAHDFCEFFAESVKEKDKINVALSGGSTPKIVFDHLAKNYKTKIDWSKISFYWGDERCVPPDHNESNYKMAKERLFDKIDIPRENIHRIHGESDPDERIRSR